jgi:hypothetical protein
MGELIYSSIFLWYYMEVSGQLHAPAALPPGERAPGTHWIRCWVSPRVGLDVVEERKILHCRGIEPGLFSPSL